LVLWPCPAFQDPSPPLERLWVLVKLMPPKITMTAKAIVED
jgi:hypothetical protein